MELGAKVNNWINWVEVPVLKSLCTIEAEDALLSFLLISTSPVGLP